MELFNGVDGAYAGGPLPAGTRILAGYVGEPGKPGNPDTPHIWTQAEWNEYLNQDTGLRALPIYTHNYPGDPRECAHNATAAVLELGWLPNIGRLVVVDLETLVDGQYQTELASAMDDFGFEMLPYQNVWAAQAAGWTGHLWAPVLSRYRPTALNGKMAGIQWQWGNAWDYDVFGRYVWDRAGRGLRG